MAMRKPAVREPGARRPETGIRNRETGFGCEIPVAENLGTVIMKVIRQPVP